MKIVRIVILAVVWFSTITVIKGMSHELPTGERRFIRSTLGAITTIIALRVAL